MAADTKVIGPKGRAVNLNVDGFIWIVGRREERPPNPCPAYHIQGVADTEELAIGMCADESYWIGPLPKNVALPKKVIEWVGLYYPLRKAEPKKTRPGKRNDHTTNNNLIAPGLGKSES